MTIYGKIKPEAKINNDLDRTYCTAPSFDNRQRGSKTSQALEVMPNFCLASSKK